MPGGKWARRGTAKDDLKPLYSNGEICLYGYASTEHRW